MRMAAKGRKAILALGTLVVLLAAGCSGAPDASGSWQLSLPVAEGNADSPSEGTMVYSLDLQQAEDGGLTGTATAVSDGSSCSYEILGPTNVSGSTAPASLVTEEGDITLNLEGDCDEDASWLNSDFVLSGEINGDEMSGQARDALSAEEAADGVPDTVAFADTEDLYAPATGTWTATRGSGEAAEPDLGSSGGSGEEEVLSSDDKSDYVATDAGATAEEAREAVERFQQLDRETGSAVEDLESRLVTLENPQAALGEALGPDNRDPEIFDCASDPPSCVTASLEEYLERDRDTFEEEGYGPEGCAAVSGAETYTSYRDFDATGGADYVAERKRITEASEGLTTDARETLAQARETEAAYKEAEEMADEANVPNPGNGPTHQPSEVEQLVGAASEAQESVEAALPGANERYAAYKSRAESAIAEAEALYARASCAFVSSNTVNQ